MRSKATLTKSTLRDRAINTHSYLNRLEKTGKRAIPPSTKAWRIVSEKGNTPFKFIKRGVYSLAFFLVQIIQPNS